MNELYQFHGHNFNDQLLEQYDLKKIILSNLSNDEIYLTYLESKDKIQKFTFKEISTLALKFFSFIESLKLAPEARIGISYPNSFEIVPIVLGTILANKSFILINPKENFNRESVDFCFELSLEHYIKNTNDNLSPKDFLIPNTDFEKEFCLFSSSGTTGISKTVVHTSKSIIANLAATINAHNLQKRKTIFNCLPLYHVNGFNFAFLATYFSSSKLIHSPNFFQPAFFNIIETYCPEIINLVPTLLRLLNDDPRKKDISLYSNYIVTAASFLSLKDAKAFYEVYKIPIIQSYGLSETVNFSTISPTQFTDFNFQEYLYLDNDRLSIGTAVYGNELVISKNSPSDEYGEICIRGWNVFQKYLDNERDTKSAFIDQYFHTGDLGYTKQFNGQEFFFISGRLKEIIKYNGALFHLADIDQYFLNNNAIKNCVSCSYFSEGEEKLGLLITTELSESEIIDYFNKKYSKLIKLDKIIITHELPIGLTGKKNRNEASKRILAQR